MKKVLLRTLGLAILGLFVTANGFAGNVSLTLNPYPWNYIEYSFVDQYNVFQDQFIAPYPVSVSFNNLTGSGNVACYDLNNPNYLGGTYFGTLKYSTTPAEKAISWLADHVRVTPTSDVATLGALANAMWEIGFPSSNNWEGGYLPIDPASAPWITAAWAALDGGYQADTIIFIPDDVSTQRFGFIESTIPLTPSPEPASLALLGSGVLGLAGVLRRRFGR